MNKYTVISKVVGGAAAGLMLFEANNEGKVTSKMMQKKTTANRLPDEYLNSMRMDTKTLVGGELKKEFFKWQLDDNIPEVFAAIKGYAAGVFESLTTNIIPVALATGALLFKKAGRFCAVGLGLCGAKYLLYDVFNLGKPEPLGDKF